MKKTIATAVALLMSVGAVYAQDEDAKNPTADMVEGKSSFKETWVHPDADFSKYSKIHLWESHFEYRDVGPARKSRSTMMSTRNREFGISEEDRSAFQQVVSEVFREELEKGKNYEITDDVGEGVLLLRGAMLDIISLVPPQSTGRSDIYLSSVGEATLVVEAIDAVTGKTLAIVSERRAIEPPGGQIDSFSMPANRMTIMIDIKRWARRQASKLRKELDKSAK